MIDREKVAEALECYRLHPDSSEHCKKKDCPYNNNDPHYGYWCCSNRILYDAVRLLKEQERKPAKPEVERSGGGTTWWHVCGACKTAINPNDKYCHECGVAIDWGRDNA